MSRPYVLCMLLEHGALTRAQALEITGWTERKIDRALEMCMERRWIRRRSMVGLHRFLYELA